MKLINWYRKYREDKYRKLRFRLGIDRLLYEQTLIENVYIPASVVHQQVFPKYKNILKGKKVVLIAGGPTVDFFEPFGGDEYVYAGINYAFMSRKWQLSYLFSSDCNTNDYASYIHDLKKMIAYKGNNCIKFLGYREKNQIPEWCRTSKNVENYFIAENDYGLVYKRDIYNVKYPFAVDISVSPIKGYETTAINAMQILLWMHPEEILLVGCDCSIGHCQSTGYEKEICRTQDFSEFKCNWELIKTFIDDFYPDIKITSLNPVGLKGFFNDIYTEEYLKSKKQF